MRPFTSLPAAACCLIMAFIGLPAVAAPDAPVRGMNMDQVTQQYGEPQEIKAAVGDPPITRWVYEGYTVYFDHNYVIHSVHSDAAAGSSATDTDAGAGQSQAAAAEDLSTP